MAVLVALGVGRLTLVMEVLVVVLVLVKRVVQLCLEQPMRVVGVVGVQLP
jgi:hypothetical protein